MSLLAPRPMDGRASVVLPTVTCSTCSAPIPLNSLGDHICRPTAGPSSRMPNRAAPRQIPKPSGLSIETTRHAPSSSASYGPAPPFARPFAGSPGSAGSSPGSINYQYMPSPASLHAPSPAFGRPQQETKTPSPTNPFFPHNDDRAGPSRPFEAPPPVDPVMPDMMSGGNAGMAGVGRRAFAAAAWGVRAGVALANGARQGQEGMQRELSPVSRGPSPRGPSPPRPEIYDHPPRSTPSPQPLLPKFPLANRPRADTVSAGSSNDSAPLPRGRQASVDSTVSAQTSQGDSIAQLLKARQGDAPQRSGSDSSKPFFDRYKAMVAGSGSSETSPVLGLASRRGSNESPNLSRSPEQGTFRVDSDDEDSALPWTIPSGETPDQRKVESGSKPPPRHAPLARHKTANSSSSQSSGSSARSGLTSESTEEVVTPSQSWEGIADSRVDAGHSGKKAGVGLGFGIDDREYLAQINEDDEEHVVFGVGRAKDAGKGIKPSTSDSSLATTASITNPYRAHSRAHTAPENHQYQSRHHRSPSTASNANSQSHGDARNRRTKVCVKCNEQVGGERRFVERDGVVLCEKDWKKLYLPSCRRCRLPIEKSAVSSSDGQLKGKWHRACFTCTRCDEALQGDSFYVLDGRPWCQFHYHEENGTLCASKSCRQPIEGRCLVAPVAGSLESSAQVERFHPGHLHCDHLSGTGAKCMEDMTEYYAVGSGRYCDAHVGEVLRREGARGGTSRAEKRRTRMVDLGGGMGLR